MPLKSVVYDLYHVFESLDVNQLNGVRVNDALIVEIGAEMVESVVVAPLSEIFRELGLYQA